MREIKDILDDGIKDEDLAIEIVIRIARKENQTPISSTMLNIDEGVNVTQASMAIAELEKYKHEILTKYYIYDLDIEMNKD